MMGASEHGEKVQRLFGRGFGDGDLSVVDDVVATSYHHQNLDFIGDGPEGMKAWIQLLRSGVSNFRIDIDEFISEGDRSVARWTATMKHTGELLGAPATGNDIDIRGIAIHHWRDGKIVEEFELFEEVKLMTAIGLLPSATASS